jgi:hypothetical protein
VWDALAWSGGRLEWETTRWVESLTAGLGGNGGTTAYTFARLTRGTMAGAAKRGKTTRRVSGWKGRARPGGLHLAERLAGRRL